MNLHGWGLIVNDWCGFRELPSILDKCVIIPLSDQALKGLWPDEVQLALQSKLVEKDLKQHERQPFVSFQINEVLMIHQRMLRIYVIKPRCLVIHGTKQW
jgi:hypothetical protein